MGGSIGHASALSFQDGKLTSAGEGGVFLTDSEEIYQRAAALGHYERLRDLPDPRWRAVSGFSFGEKYRMATITAAIGVVQMKHWRGRIDHPSRERRQAGTRRRRDRRFRGARLPRLLPLALAQRARRLPAGEARGHHPRAADRGPELAEGAQVTSPARRDTRIPHTDLQRILHKHPVFAGDEHGTEEILWEVLGPAVRRIDYKSLTLPVTEDPEVPCDTIQLPAFTRPAEELIGQYAQAFAKVAAHAGRLAQAGG